MSESVNVTITILPWNLLPNNINNNNNTVPL